MHLDFNRKADALNNILLHKILVAMGYNNQIKLLINLIFWNILIFNRLRFLKLFSFWRLLCSYSSDSSKRDQLSEFFHGQFATMDSRFLLGLMKISTGLGFFEIGSRFNTKHCQSLICNFEKKKNSYTYKNAIKGALSLGDIKRVEGYIDTSRYSSFVEKDPIFFDSVLLFLQLCSSSVQFFDFTRDDFDKYLSDQNVILLGPAQLGEEFMYADIENPIVCRRVGLGADNFNEARNNFSNFKIAYTDLLFVKNKNNLSSWIHLTGLDYVVVVEDVMKTHTLRTARSFNNLFSSGATNKMPLAIYDILRGSPKKLYCDGITFFASEISYTNDNLDFSNDKVRINNHGSTGSDFFVSIAMAEHNVFVNRTMVKNLSFNPILIFSNGCRDILNLSNEEYATRLDHLYGHQKR
jgi:hypothetical protein